MKNIIKILSGFLFFCVLLVSCVSAPTQTNETLTVYIKDHSLQESIFRTADALFREQYPNIELKKYRLPEEGDTQTVLHAEMMAGRGPDLILMDSYGTFQSVDKTCMAGAFCDLQPFLDADPDYDPADYYQNILSVGKYGDSQLVFPLIFIAQIPVTTQRLLTETGFSLARCGTRQEYCAEVLRVARENPSGMVYPQLDGSNMRYLGVDLFDLRTRTVHLDTPEFRALWQTAKEYADLFPESSFRLASNAVRAIDEMVKKERMCSESDPLLAASLLQARGETAVILPSRDTQGKISARVTLSAGISSRSPNQQNAYQYLKVLLSVKPGYNQTISISQFLSKKSNMESLMEDYREDCRRGELAFHWQDEPDPPIADPGDDIAAEFLSVFDRVESCAFEDSSSLNKIQSAMRPYMEGKASLDECVKNAQTMLEIYVSE